MDWQDEELEAFLRQFRPRKPKALPTHRRAVVAMAVAAVALLAVVIPMRSWWTLPAGPDDSTRTSVSTSSVTTPKSSDEIGQPGPRRVQLPAELSHTPQNESTEAKTNPPAPADAAAMSRRPILSPGKGLQRPVPAPSDAVGLPTLSPLAGLQRPGPAPSNGPVSVNSGSGNGRIRVGGAVRPPIRLVNVSPVYPEDAQAAGIQGAVVLEVAIGEDGFVIEVQVLGSIPELDQAAIDAVSQWQYEPTLLNGEPVEVEMTVTINFTLR